MKDRNTLINEPRSEPIGRARAGWSRAIGLSAGAIAIGLAAWWWWPMKTDRQRTPAAVQPGRPAVAEGSRVESHHPNAFVILKAEEHEQVGLKTAKVVTGATRHMVTAPGKILPDETHYAYITPRASGVVRSVNARLGQTVRKGDLLATIDSPVVGDARLELFSKLQSLDLATAQADWQETIYRNTISLIERLHKGESPQVIHEAFTKKPVGENRERLMTAYARNKFALATMSRNRELYTQNLISPKQFQQVEADYEVAQATYESLMDQMDFETRIANTRAQQVKVQAENAVRAAQERLRILGVKPDGTDPVATAGPLAVGKLATRPAEELNSPGVEPAAPETAGASATQGTSLADDAGTPSDGKSAETKPLAVSNYSIWAPFDGTILDREMIIPGVAVDTTHRIFTLADLSRVYVEVNIHENNFDMLEGARGGQVKFTSPAYPGRDFLGEVIYSGDLVEDTSRTVKLLGRAENPGRLLKPGMFVEVEVMSHNSKPAVQIPASSLLTHADRSFVYVKTDSDRFEERDVTAEGVVEGQVLITRGLRTGEEVVIQGAYKLKSLASGSPAPEH